MAAGNEQTAVTQINGETAAPPPAPGPAVAATAAHYHGCTSAFRLIATAAGRKKLSDLMKKRWADKRKGKTK